MKNFIKLPLLVGAIALTSAFAGCGNNAETTAPNSQTAAAPMGGNMDNMATSNAATPTGATLGSATQAGPFEVTLALDAPEPKVGDTSFKVTVTRDGKPVEDASVKLALTMPQMSMGGPNATLAHTQGGVYAGKANLSMGGAYSTKVEVSAGADKGEAIYEFRAIQ